MLTMQTPAIETRPISSANIAEKVFSDIAPPKFYTAV